MVGKQVCGYGGYKPYPVALSSIIKSTTGVDSGQLRWPQEQGEINPKSQRA